LFGQRRKKLLTQMRAHYGLDADAAAELAAVSGVDPQSRPEQIEPAGLRRLAANLPRKDGP